MNSGLINIGIYHALHISIFVTCRSFLKYYYCRYKWRRFFVWSMCNDTEAARKLCTYWENHIGRHRDLAEWMIEKGATCWKGALRRACIGGHRELVKLMIEKGATCWNLALYGACEGGHRELVELMIEKGARDWNTGLEGACIGGHRKLAEFMIEKGATKSDFFRKQFQYKK